MDEETSTLSEDSIVEQLSARLEPKRATQEPKEPKQAPPEAEDAPEPVKAEAEPDAEEPNEERPDVEPDEANYEEIDFNGERYSVPKELKGAFLMQQDYTRKTQEVAEIRRQVEAEQQSAQQLKQQSLQGIQFLQMLVQQQAVPPPDPSLLDTDPVEYMRQEHAHRGSLQKLHALNAEMQRQAQHLQQEQQQQFQRERAELGKKLPELIPEWKDTQRAQKEWGSVCEYLAKNGYTNDEIGTATDPRAFALSRKAMLFDQLMAQKKAALPVPTKVATPGGPKAPAEATAIQKARQAFKQSRGNNEHAAAALIAHQIERMRKR